MSFLSRLLIALCIITGFANGMVHTVSHQAGDECASHCDPLHDTSSDPLERNSSHEKDGDGKIPHHHTCCHVPSADRTAEPFLTAISFNTVLLGISRDHMIAPEAPVFSLDLPPLI